MDFKKIFKYSILVALLSIIIKVLFFGKELLYANYYGTSEVISEFNEVNIIPTLVLNSIGPAIGIILLDRVITYKNKKKNVPFILIKVSQIEMKLLLYIVLFIIFATFLSLMTSPNLGISFLLSVILSFLFLFQVSYVYFLQANSNYYAGNYAILLQILINIPLIILLQNFNHNYFLLTIVFIVSVLIQLMYLYYLSKKFKVRFNIVNEKKGIYGEFFAILLGIGLMEIVFSIAKFFAVYSDQEGKISALNYSIKLMNLPFSLILFSLMTVLFPEITKLEKSGLFSEVKKGMKNILVVILIMFIPISCIFYVFGEAIITFTFFRGEFDENSLLLTTQSLKAIIFSLIPLAVITLMVRILILTKQYKKIIVSVVSTICILLFILTIFQLAGYSKYNEITITFLLYLLSCYLYLGVYGYKLKEVIKIFSIAIFGIIIYTVVLFFK